MPPEELGDGEVDISPETGGWGRMRAMRIHHLNGATMCPVGGRHFLGSGSGFTGATLVCHCLLIETDAGLVLVDTALGLDDVQAPEHAGVRRVMKALGARFDAEETVVRQVERLGFRREDVRHIVLTHLDLDHAGGLSDFPRAKVHVYAEEHAAAVVERRLREKGRYHESQWAHGPDWALYRPQGEPWFGFECVRQLEGLPPEVLLVPLTGHTRGHCAVAVDRGDRWLLHAGDAYFFHGEMKPDGHHCPPGLRLFQTLFEVDRKQRLANQERLRELVRTQGNEVDVFCAHDLEEYRRLSSAAETVAATPRRTHG
jgi:glyoxylase-like metal-dependent hydrolase (beta-lactamase superfamily II)